MRSDFLTAEWKNLIMANYIVDPVLLQPYLPYKTELDQHNGNCYVSLVGFMFTNTKVKGISIPFHINFEEVNLRFYVRYNDNGIWKRGVVFIKEIVPKAAISFVANTFYKEKYCCMPMRNSFSENANEMKVGYQWKYKGKWNSLEAVTGSNAHPLLPGSEEQFISEHYWGYSRYSGRITNEYEVKHPSWKVYPIISYSINCDFENLYGPSFSFLKTATPNAVFMAKGSAISVSNKKVLS